jgi:hypothetical protein
VGARRDEAHVAPALAAGLVVRAHDQEAGVLALGARVGLERDRGEAGDLGEPGLEVPEEPAVAAGLLLGAKGWSLENSGQETGKSSLAAFSFIVHEPREIIDWQSVRSFASSRLM